MWFKRYRQHFSSSHSIKEVFDLHRELENKDHELGELQFLSDLVKVFRPLKLKDTQISIEPLITYLREHQQDRDIFREYLVDVVGKKDFKMVLTEYGILQNKPFFQELRKRIFARFVPEQPASNTLEFVLTQIFFFYTDIEWLEKIPANELEEFCEVLELGTIYREFHENDVYYEIFKALNLLSHRVSGQALETEVIKMVPELASLDSPFEGLEQELDIIEKRFRSKNLSHLKKGDPDYQKLLAFHAQCVERIQEAYKNSSRYGISMNVNQRLLRVRQELKRFAELAEYLVLESPKEALPQSIKFGLSLIRYHCSKNNISELINDSTQIITYEITQHTAKTGEHYITSDGREYWHMLKSSMGGGLIVGILCITKVLLSKIDVSDFGQAFLFSMNYAIGFIAIYLLGFTLATKQPAMTATTLIHSIEQGMNKSTIKKNKHKAFAELFARLFRSQFIAFVGNVIIAFPVAMLLAYGIDWFFEDNIVSGKHEKLMADLSIWHSPVIFHSAIAGVFLFLSGIISGSISNRNKHIDLYHRIAEHPGLKQTMGNEATHRLGKWLEKKWPGVASNFWFGVFMGSTASFGVFIGLNLDIRHITFASGNLALGIFGSEFSVTANMLILGLIGIAVIGLVNFIVSFIFSLALALRSRKIPWRELIDLFRSVWNHFLSRPLSFFIPLTGK